VNVERSNPVRLGSAVEGRLTPVGSRDAFGRWRSSDPYQLFASALYHDALGASIAGVPDELWLCAKRLTGTTEDFYAGITTGEVP